MLKRVLTGITISLGSVCADQASRIRLMAFEPISPISRDGESLLFDPAPEDQFRGVIRVKNSEGDLISSTISLNRFSAVVEVPGGRESLTILRKVGEDEQEWAKVELAETGDYLVVFQRREEGGKHPSWKKPLVHAFPIGDEKNGMENVRLLNLSPYQVFARVGSERAQIIESGDRGDLLLPGQGGRLFLGYRAHAKGPVRVVQQGNESHPGEGKRRYILISKVESRGLRLFRFEEPVRQSGSKK